VRGSRRGEAPTSRHLLSWQDCLDSNLKQVDTYDNLFCLCARVPKGAEHYPIAGAAMLCQARLLLINGRSRCQRLLMKS